MDFSETKFIRKIDRYIIPWLSLLYLLSFLDRGSIANARLFGLLSDVHITESQYLIALSMFFIPYSLLEPLCNSLLLRIKPAKWLSLITFLWGVVMTLHGFSKNFWSLVALRILLGACEAGMYPGIVFYMSCWYKSKELGLRLAIFFSMATVSGAFSGLLAAFLSKMGGLGGLHSWAWIFVVEGLATILVSIPSLWIIKDLPVDASFLTEEERLYAITRLKEDSKVGVLGENTKENQILASLSDVKTYYAMVLFAAFDGALYAFSLFIPSIINQLGARSLLIDRSFSSSHPHFEGFEATSANLLSVPVYTWGCVCTVIVGFYGDKIGLHSLINVFLFALGAFGYLLLILSHSAVVSYFACFLAVSSIYPLIPNSVSWVSGNTEGAHKRGVTLGMAIGFGNLQGVVSSNVYRAKDSEIGYRMGHTVVLIYLVVGLICSVLYALFLKRENERRDRGDRDEIIDGKENPKASDRNGRYASVEEAQNEKGDQFSGFRYTL